MKSSERAAFTDSSPTVLVTGHRGVVGSRVAAGFAELVGQPNVLLFDGDISSEVDIQKFLDKVSMLTNVVHCAAVVPVGSVRKDPVRAFTVNAIGPGLLFRAVAARFPGAHFLHVSSSHVYRPQAGLIHEGAELAPPGAYGKTKLTGEYLLQEEAISAGLSVGIARVFSIFAPDQESSFLYPGIKERLSQLSLEKVLRLPGWNNVRDFSSADDIARCLIWLSQNKIIDVVNIGTGRGTAIAQFAEYVAGRQLLFSDDDAELNPTEVVADISRLKSLGCAPPKSLGVGFPGV